MNRRLSIVFLFFFILTSLGLSGQSWNANTICNRDFKRSTGERVTILPLVNDKSLAALQVSAISYQEHGVVSFDNQSISFTPETGFEGIAKVIYTACDAWGNCGIGEVSVLVANPSKNVYHDTIYQGVYNARPFTFYLPDESLVLKQNPLFGNIQKLGEFQYSYTPSSNASKQEVLNFENGAKKVTVIVNIIDQYKSPQNLKEDIVYLNKNTSKLFDVRLNDNPNFSITAFTKPSIGTLIKNADNTFTFSTTLDFEGITTFDYTACNQGVCETSRAYLYVSDFLPREDLNPIFRTAEGKSLVLPYEIPITDYEFKIISQPAFGMIDFYKGINSINSSCDQLSVFNPLVYTPLPGFVGKDQFIVNFCLTSGTKQCAPVKITVETYNDPSCTPSSEFVWPGDANTDGLVNLKDVITISQYLGTLGISRANASNSWINQKIENWNRPGLINAKNADSNGDGKVDQEDINTVIANFNQSHKLLPQGIFQLLPSGLQATPVASVIAPGEDAVIQLSFGNDQNVLADIESISFDLEFNDQVIKAEDLEISIIDNSWFGYDNSILGGRIDGTGKVSIQFVSAIGNSRNGQGRTVKVKAKGGPITGHIEGFKIPKELPLDFTIKNIQLGQSNGNTLAFADTKAKVMIDFTKRPQSIDLTTFPNPAVNWIGFRSNHANELIQKVSFVDLTGRTVLSKNIYPSKEFKQEVNRFQPGIYLVQVQTNHKVYTQKVEVVR